MFVGMEFCPHCGANFTRETIGGSGLPCPQCKTPMMGMRVGATPLLECDTCYGTWLDTATFTDLCSSKEERGTFAAEFGKREHADGTSAASAASARVVYLPCPSCGKIMNRQNFGHASGVVIDVCKGHGAWLQQGELHAVLAFIDSGGLERARDAERAREKADEHLRQLEQGAPPPPAAVQGSSFRIATHGNTSEPVDSLLSRALSALFS